MTNTEYPPPGPCEYCGARGGEGCLPYCISTETADTETAEEVMPTNPKDRFRQIADEAYGAGCATGDPFYAGVEAVALWLGGADRDTLDPRQRRLIELVDVTTAPLV